jgi:23S rRNA (uracil1939-C5)-methyltransferase
MQGQIVFTPFSLPGELVHATVEKASKGLLEGNLVEVLESSPYRVDPFCPVYRRCGGCHLQHADYTAQQDLKTGMLRETLARLGKVEYSGTVAWLAADPRAYRNRIQLHFHEGRTGMMATRSHRLVPVDRCPVASPKLNEVITAMSRLARHSRFPAFLRSCEFFTNGSDVQINVLDTGKPLAKWFFEWLAEEIPGIVEGPLEYPVAGLPHRVSGKSFFQVNRLLLEPLTNLVTGDQQGTRALDLYAGVGLFALRLASRFDQVTAIESSRSATDDCHFNAQRASLPLGVAHAPVEEFLSRLDLTPDLVIADPPRAGLGKGVTADLLRLRPSRIVLVSCDPATLARDLKPLLDSYDIERLTLIDLFPNTYHLETVAHLRLR